MSLYTLDERNGNLYIKEKTISFCDPIEITHYWPTGVRYVTFASWFLDPERAREALGTSVNPLCNPAIRFQDERGWVYSLPSGGEAKPDYTETTPIPEPKQRGKVLPIRWKNGRWERETQKGWKLA